MKWQDAQRELTEAQAHGARTLGDLVARVTRRATKQVTPDPVPQPRQLTAEEEARLSGVLDELIRQQGGQS